MLHVTFCANTSSHTYLKQKTTPIEFMCHEVAVHPYRHVLLTVSPYFVKSLGRVDVVFRFRRSLFLANDVESSRSLVCQRLKFGTCQRNTMQGRSQVSRPIYPDAPARLDMSAEVGAPSVKASHLYAYPLSHITALNRMNECESASARVLCESERF